MSKASGPQMIIELQKMAGITETKEQATKGWNGMTKWERESTERVWSMLCKKEDKD